MLVEQQVAYEGLFDWLFGSKPKAKQSEGEQNQQQIQRQISPTQSDTMKKILLIGGGLLLVYFLLQGGKAEKKVKTA